MEKIKSLADQLREELGKTTPQNKAGPTGRVAADVQKAKSKPPDPGILSLITDYDNSQNKSMVHVRFDEKTVRLMNQFKMATNIDVTRLVSFSVKHLFDTYPELKQIIKHFIQNTEL